MIELTPEQRDLQALAARFAREVIRPVAARYDESETVPWDVLKEAARVGLTSFGFPEEYGGAGLTDALTLAIVTEELCWGCLGIGNLITSGYFGAQPILELGTPEQKARYIPLLADPEEPRLCAISITEPDHGSDAAGIKTLAVRDGDHYVLRGRKAFCSNGGVSEFYVVFATVNPESRHKGITAFIVEKGTPGLSFGRKERKMGQRAIQVTSLILDDVRVPAANRLGEEGQGFVGLMRTFDRARVLLGAACVGVARAALEYARDYALRRVQFGKPIAQHQAIAFKIADMATAVDAARLLVWRAALMCDRGEPFSREAAMAKLFASEKAFEVCHQALQIMGGLGYIRDCPVEKWLRDVRLEQIEEGTSEIMRLIISRREFERAAAG